MQPENFVDDDDDGDRIVRPAETSRLVALSNMQIMRLEQRGLFPPRFKIPPEGGKNGASGHRLKDVRRYIAQRAASVTDPPRAA